MSQDSESEAHLDLPDLVRQVFTILAPLTPGVRSRIVGSALSLLGDAPLQMETAGSRGEIPPIGATPVNVGKRAALWLRRHDINEDVLNSMVHMDGVDVDLIGEVPGTNKREQTINCYVLTGLLELLRRDETRFTDEQAVELCKRVGCYDRANHAATRGHFGNRITGSKESGYVLTNPGLDAAAALVRSAGLP